MTILEKKQSKQLKFSILFHKFEKKAIFEIFHILMSFFEYVLFLRIFLLCIEARGRPPGYPLRGCPQSGYPAHNTLFL
jgi:hypothetical protein